MQTDPALHTGRLAVRIDGCAWLTSRGRQVLYLFKCLYVFDVFLMFSMCSIVQTVFMCFMCFVYAFLFVFIFWCSVGVPQGDPMPNHQLT